MLGSPCTVASAIRSPPRREWVAAPIPRSRLHRDAVGDKHETARSPREEETHMDLLVPDLLATLTILGKSIGFGLAVGLAAFGTALGVGLIFASMIQSAARQPEASTELRPIMWLGFALTEAVIFYGLVGAMLLVFLV
jgi:F-type H+-transporting ATPase subunit c